MENALSNARINNNLRPMYVKEIIFEHTDENHFLTVNEILGILQNCYAISSTRKTIYDDIAMLIESGFDIECVKGKQGTNMYHVLSREFDSVELRIIIDAVESLKSLPLSKGNTLIRKISRLAGPSAESLLQNTFVDRYHRSENSQIYYIIDTITNAITLRLQIAIKYCEHIFTAKQNSCCVLQVSPYRLVCCNNYYFLFAYSEKHKKITAFRLDYISEIPKLLNKKIIPEPDYLYSDICRETMFQETYTNESVISLEFESSELDTVIEHCGQELDYTLISNSICRAKVNVTVDNSFFAWLFKSEGKVRISGPNVIKEQYVRMVSREMARL